MEQDSLCTLAGHHEGPQRIVAILVSPAAGESSGAPVKFNLGVLPRRWACQATDFRLPQHPCCISPLPLSPTGFCLLIWTLVRLHRK